MIILLVDDEYFFRKTLIQTIKGSTLNVERILEASNGEEALKILENVEVDIILVDINMPRMNGLCFVGAVRRLNIDVRIIMVTGYDDFEYARSALKLGVVDYLLKPIQDAELLKVLSTQFDHVHEVNERRFAEKLKEEQNHLLAKNYYIKRLLFEKTIAETEQVRSSLLDIGSTLCSWDGYYACVGALDCRKELLLEETEKFNQLLICSLEQAFVEQAELCIDNESRVVVILSAKAGTTTEYLRNQLKPFSEAITFPSYSFGISSVCASFELINIAYDEAVKALSCKVVSEHASLVFYDGLQKSRYGEYHVTKKIREQLYLGVSQRDYSYVEDILNGILSTVSKVKVRLDYLEIIGIHLLEPCMHTLIDKNLIEENPYLELYNSMYEGLGEKSDLVGLFSYIKDVYFKCCTVNNDNGSVVNLTVKDVLIYIGKRYPDSLLSIEEIAEAVSKNYNYLCVLFKKAMGVTINDYIMNVRMKKAMELISEGGHNVSEIAENTGFSNISYFTKCFKKKFGYPPSRFLLK